MAKIFQLNHQHKPSKQVKKNAPTAHITFYVKFKKPQSLRFFLLNPRFNVDLLKVKNLRKLYDFECRKKKTRTT